MKKKQKYIRKTEDEYEADKIWWIELGERNARKEIRRELAKVLGLFDLFEQRED